MSYNYLSNDSGVAFPVGAIIAWPSNTIPSGWALCDGSSYSTTQNPVLAVILRGTEPIYIAKLPDLRAAFLRQTGTDTTGIDSYTGPSLRGIQFDSFLSHTHVVNDPGHDHAYWYSIVSSPANEPTGNNPLAGGNTESRLTTSSKINATVNSTTGRETTPYCYGVNWIIKLG